MAPVSVSVALAAIEKLLVMAQIKNKILEFIKFPNIEGFI
jgi:hypothetical protein